MFRRGEAVAGCRLVPPRVAALAFLLATLSASSGSAQPAPGSLAAAADSAGGLAPTSAPPWNPPRAARVHEPWEMALNAPFTLASLPVRLLGAVLNSGLLVVQENNVVPRVQVMLSLSPPWGIGLRPANLGERTGTAGAVTFEPNPERSWLRASLEGSTLRYGRGHAELGPRWLFAAYTHDWRPQEPYFGAGMDAREEDASNFSLRRRSAEARLRLHGGSAVRGAFESWAGEQRTVVRRGRESGRPSLEEVFPQLAAATFDAPQDHAVAGARLSLDARAGRPHWTHGWRLAGQAEHFGHPLSGRGFLFPGDAASPAFSRTTLEAEAGFSFMRDPRTVRLSARLVDTRAADASQPPALHDLAVLGGAEGLSGFEPGRFQGMDLAIARLSYIFPLAQTAELELSGEVGGVFGDVWRDAGLDRAEASYGVAYRLRTERAPVVAVGMDFSREAARFRFSLGGVE